jgi:glycine oxidase
VSGDDVAVIGGGIVGLAIAWRCAQRGLAVRVHDPAPGAGASHAAAGMLAPVGESTFGEEALTALLVESARRWPGFAAELGRAGSGRVGLAGTGLAGAGLAGAGLAGAGLAGAGLAGAGLAGAGLAGPGGSGTGADLGYRTVGTLTVALTGDDLAEASRLWSYQRGLGLGVHPLRPTALRDAEPALSPRVRGGAFAPADHDVDPRRVVAALRAALAAAGVPIVRAAVRDMSAVRAGVVVVAAGCGSAALTGLPIRPVKGQILRLRAARPAFRHTIRGYADGRHVYLVPRADGRVVVGATMEERTDAEVTAGAVLELLRAATDLVPELAEFELVETLVRHRPATVDNLPVLGVVRPAVIVAAGHHRHGVLLAPVTADLIAELVATGRTDPTLIPFDPNRFAEAPTCA